MRMIMLVFIFTAVLCAAVQPLTSVAVATDVQQSSGMTVQLLTDWNAGYSFVVSGNKITAVNHGDGSTDVMSLPINAQNSCISPEGLIATTFTKSSGSLIPTKVQTARFNGPGNWDIKTLDLDLSFPINFGGFANCAFAPDGTLWLASNLLESPEVPKIVSIDVGGQKILKRWRTDQNALAGIASTSNGVYLGVSYPSTSSSGLGMIGSDGQYRVVSLSSQPSGSANTFVAPNGYIFVGNKVYDPHGEPVSTAAPEAGGSPAIAWPGSDAWYGYILLGGKLFSENFYQDLVYPLGPTSVYFAIASRRRSDGTDFLIGVRDGMIDFYSITPPAVVDYAANGGSNQPGPLAPGMHISIFGQGLTAKADEADIAGSEIATQLGKTVVRLDGKPLRLDYAGFGQINARIPSDTTNGAHTLGIVIDGKTAQAAVTIVDQSLAAFQWAPDPTNQKAIAPILTDGNYRLISDPALSPAYAQPSPGDMVILWATGGGRTAPLIDDNIASPAGIYPLVITPQILVDGQQAYVAYAGRGNGFSGLDQINFVVPSGLTAGPHDFQVNGMVYRGGIWTK